MPKQSQQSAWVWLWVSVAVVALDQVSKWWAVNHLGFGAPLRLLPWLNLRLVFNPGAAFSFLGTSSGWQIALFSIISIVIILVLGIWLVRSQRRDVLLGLSLSLLIGGALGNLIDRLRLSYVVDFFDFHVGTWHFATFNLADAAITIGTILLVVKLLFFSDKAQ